MSWRSDVELLADRSFAMLFVARLFSNLGSAFTPVALAFGVLHASGGSPDLLSGVMACEAIPMVLFLLVGGVLADHFPRAAVLMIGEILSTAAFGVLGALLLIGFTPLWALGIGAALSGTGIALVGPALTGILPELVPAARLQQANGLLGIATSAARILGVVVAGAVVAGVGGPIAVLIGAAMFAASAVAVGFLPRGPRSTESLSAGGVLADLRDGWSEFTSHEWLWVNVLQWSFIVLVFQGAHGVIGPVLADAELGGALPWSWILAGESVGMVLGVIVAMRLHPRRPILLAVVVTALFVPVPFIALGLGAPLAAVIVLAALGGMSTSVFGVMWNTTMQRLIPQESLSRVSSYDALGSFMLGPIGLLIAGPIALALGARRAMLASGIALVVICSSALVSRDVRTVGWPDAVTMDELDDTGR